VHGARVPTAAGGAGFRPADGLDPALPTVMRKALRLGLAALRPA